AAGDAEGRAAGRQRIDAQGGHQHHVAIGLAIQVQRRAARQRGGRRAGSGPAQASRVFLRLVVEGGHLQAAVAGGGRRRRYGVAFAVGGRQLQGETVR